MVIIVYGIVEILFGDTTQPKPIIERRVLMKQRTTVYEAIDNERDYQDNKWGTIEQHPQDVSGWILIMREELQEAEQEWVNANAEASLEELLQVVATGVACLEQHGVIERAANRRK